MTPDLHAPGRRGRWSRRRVACLIAVHLAIAIHLIHWQLADRTLAPLELNEVLHTLELGILTAGFFLMALAALATLFFGRFFCGWACHLLALQDLAAWILKKVHVKPRPVRSRILLVVPFVALGYMFVWPHLMRLIEGRPHPGFHVAGEAEGWASFVTSDFARNLPGPLIGGLTLVICGGLAIHALGSRSFCRYACPYGALFNLADRVAPGRIRLRDPDACKGCAACTAACQSGVRVHEELQRHGTVVDARCLRDLDCLDACTHGAVGYGFGRPSLFARTKHTTRIRQATDFSWREEIALAALLVGFLLIYRGLYDLVPFLMALGGATIAAWLVVLAWRATRRDHVRLAPWTLRRSGRLTRAGRVFLASVVVLLLLTAHSAVVHVATRAGLAAWEDVRGSAVDVSRGTEHAVALLEVAHGAGFIPVQRVEWALLNLYPVLARWQDAERVGSDLVKRRPEDAELALQMGIVAAGSGAGDLALERLRRAADLAPDDPAPHWHAAGVHFAAGRQEAARAALGEVLRRDPSHAPARRELGALLVAAGDPAAAIGHLEQAVQLAPGDAAAWQNLAIARAQMRDIAGALVASDRAFALDPTDRDILGFRAQLEDLGSRR